MIVLFKLINSQKARYKCNLLEDSNQMYGIKLREDDLENLFNTNNSK
jgi:hypothetical protein